MKDNVARIIDANLNRAREGLRVSEEIARFILDDERITRTIKTLRHKILRAAQECIDDKKMPLIKFRDSDKDVGKPNIKTENKRSSVADIFKANIKRTEESLRVLEEFSKLYSVKSAIAFKKIRFDLYSLEKNIVKKLQALHNFR